MVCCLIVISFVLLGCCDFVWCFNCLCAGFDWLCLITCDGFVGSVCSLVVSDVGFVLYLWLRECLVGWMVCEFGLFDCGSTTLRFRVWFV